MYVRIPQLTNIRQLTLRILNVIRKIDSKRQKEQKINKFLNHQMKSDLQNFILNCFPITEKIQ